jgi:hypothetical protein
MPEPVLGGKLNFMLDDCLMRVTQRHTEKENTLPNLGEQGGSGGAENVVYFGNLVELVGARE